MAKQKQEEAANTGLRALVFLMLALIAGGAATVTVYQLIESYKRQIAEAQKPEDTKMVIIAAADLFPGLTITEQDIVGVQVPAKYLPAIEGAPDYFTSHELVVGRVPRERILANEFIRPGRLADGEQGIGLNALIDAGMRALSINIANGRAVSGFLNPGNRVDILVTMKDDEATTEEGREAQTLTLLQAVPVLAVNARVVQDEPADSEKKKKKKKSTRQDKPSVTLLVTPEQAEQVAHAERIGTITLALRNDGDKSFDENGQQGITVDELLGKKEEPKPVEKKKGPKKPPPVEQPTLEIIRGGKKTEQGVNPDGSIKLK